MIGKLNGTVEHIGENYAIIMTGGVGYRVFCPINVLADMTTQTAVSLWIETNVREDHIHLYGFESLAAQDMFLKLTSVSGIGPRLAMAIMGAFRLSVLSSAIAGGDVKTLCAAPGVGKKVAERIAVELKGKCVTTNFAGMINTDDGTSALTDLLSALETLGYRRVDIVELAQNLVRENPNADVATLVPLALKGINK